MSAEFGNHLRFAFHLWRTNTPMPSSPVEIRMRVPDSGAVIAVVRWSMSDSAFLSIAIAAEFEVTFLVVIGVTVPPLIEK